MGYVEDTWVSSKSGKPTSRYGIGKRYRGVPWLAGPKGVRGRRGPTETFNEHREAEFYIARIENGDDVAADAAGSTVTRNRKRVSFAEYVVETAGTMGAARATRQSYASHARSLAAHWSSEALDEITPDMVDVYFAGLIDRGMSKSLRAKRRTVMVTAYRRAVRAGLVTKDPTADIKPISQRQRRKKRPITDEEFGWLVDETPAWLRPALYLAYDSGLRSGELCGLYWHNVDLDGARAWIGPVMQDNGVIKNEPKNGQPEEVVLSPRTVDVLRAYARRFPGDGDDLVIREPRVGGRQPIAPPRYRHLFHRSCRLASLALPHPRPHDMRHGLGERLADAGVPIHVAQRMMRHESVTSTQVYFPTVSLDDMRGAMAAVTAG